MTSQIFFDLAVHFGNVYSGFRPKSQELHSDSVIGEVSSADDTGDEKEVEQEIFGGFMSGWVDS